jgi:hypothetical protein
MMAAVANLKQAVKSAVEDRDQQQQFNAQQQQRQQINGAPPPSAAALPSMNHSAWDFHPLMGGLMDAVIIMTAMIVVVVAKVLVGMLLLLMIMMMIQTKTEAEHAATHLPTIGSRRLWAAYSRWATLKPAAALQVPRHASCQSCRMQL